MFKVAIKLLSIQTSSADVERLFSTAKAILGELQLQTNDDLLESLKMIIGNEDEFKDFYDQHWIVYFPIE